MAPTVALMIAALSRHQDGYRSRAQQSPMKAPTIPTMRSPILETGAAHDLTGQPGGNHADQ
jgi:hypothetical protein